MIIFIIIIIIIIIIMTMIRQAHTNCVVLAELKRKLIAYTFYGIWSTFVLWARITSTSI